MGGAVSQEEQQINFSNTLNHAQQQYNALEKELLSIVETLKYFKRILFGQDICIFTNYKNFTYPNSDYASD